MKTERTSGEKRLSQCHQKANLVKWVRPVVFLATQDLTGVFNISQLLRVRFTPDKEVVGLQRLRVSRSPLVRTRRTSQQVLLYGCNSIQGLPPLKAASEGQLGQNTAAPGGHCSWSRSQWQTDSKEESLPTLPRHWRRMLWFYLWK